MNCNQEFLENEPTAHLSKLWLNIPEISEKLLTWTQNPSGILYYHGSTGTGKSYFATAFLVDCMEKKRPVRAYKEKDLFAAVKSVMDKSWDINSELKRLCEIDYFILDDLGQDVKVSAEFSYGGSEYRETGQIVDKTSDWQKNTLFQFLEERLKMSRPTIITSNLSRKVLKQVFDDRFVDRLYDNGANTIVSISGKSRRSENKKGEFNAR